MDLFPQLGSINTLKFKEDERPILQEIAKLTMTNFRF